MAGIPLRLHETSTNKHERNWPDFFAFRGVSMFNLCRAAGAALVFYLALTVAHAQISTGTIVGTVDDNTGGAVPNAAVTLTQTATGQARATQTNDHGQFTAPFLPLGNYSVSVTAPGYETQTISGINLQVDQTANLHIALKVGSVSQTVQVTAASPFSGHVLARPGDQQQ